MSIKVEGLTKVYGEQYAVDNISFEIPKGEIVGFLGPNGAGKSTTMKILTCYLPQTSGKASVCGVDTLENPMDVKRKVGYLPESNPLYFDMYVKEYLTFMADLYKLKNKKSRVAEMIEAVGLTKEQKKKIGALSKGFKQRVGLAQAMIHDPEVLILDEPTSGLDPNQLVEIRGLIKNFGKEKTVMLSTHIMQEVEAICDRIIIIKNGKIVADDKTSDISRTVEERNFISVEFDKEVNIKDITALDGVSEVKEMGANTYLIAYLGSADMRVLVSRFAQQNDLLILEMHREKEKLEETFKKLTQGE
ncbi:gliding motility-associated ABC transporter ATP-binding subunit GldA [Parvicella tangerina]|uniref:Vitamin B12 import ATP-binding protein BtuD n=1 Tax=Parvicella tangerina TaxID=2829795 RepID=A0A916JMR6_9FLAO|nr:gliding motility-associated ABC transporter ATP-binding subunit GldA [Parvicella tangerina]CAG5082521.1 Vitamin B12 import ATP-binding protein BtuD [Parvicella tangerina]